MLLGLAFFAIVFVRHLSVLNNAYATAVLPDTATIAGDEQPACILRLRVGRIKGLAQWRTWVFLVPANTSCNLLLFAGVFFWLIVGFDVFVCFGGGGALASTRLVGRIFAGEGVRCC